MTSAAQPDSRAARVHRSPGLSPNAVAAILAQLASRQLEEFAKAYELMSPRERIGALVAIQKSIRALGKQVSNDFAGAKESARDRIAKFFEAHPGEIIEGEELAVVAGISEYGRRVRELREQGRNITSGGGSTRGASKSLKRDQYVFHPQRRS